MTVRIGALTEPTPGNRTVVVFPHAGASPRFYASWCRLLPAGVDLYGVTYPGRDMLLDEPVPETLADLACNCAVELKPIIYSSSSVVVFGHSMGSLVAFETIRELEQDGVSVTALVASGADAPHLETDQSWHRAADEDLIQHLAELDSRSRDVFAVPELRRILLPTVREDFRLVESYRAELHPPVSCPIHVMTGDADPEVTAHRWAQWAVHTRAPWHVRSFAGDHFYIRTHEDDVVRHLCGILTSAPAATQ